MTLAREATPVVAMIPDDGQFDTTVLPQDDFNRFVNGRWTDAFTLTEHRAEVSMLSLLSEKVQGDIDLVVKAAVNGPRGDVSARQIADLYTSFMDEDGIERRGTDVFRADLDAIAAVTDRAQLAGVLGHLQAQGIGGIVALSVSTDTESASRYVLVLSQGGLGLPSAAQYDRPDRAGLCKQYLGHIRGLLTRIGVADADTVAAEVLRLETDLAAGHVPAAERDRDSAKPVSCTPTTLTQRPAGFGWAQWFRGLGDVPADAAVCMRQSGFLDALDTWWLSHSLDELKLWVMWRYVHEMAPFGPREVFAENFAFFGKVIIGATQPRPRWLRATSLVLTILGDAVGERYIAEYLPPGTVAAAAELVDALVRSYRTRIESATWMCESTQVSALCKLDNMVVEIGFPKTFEPREDLRVDPGDFFGNVKSGRQWYITRELARLAAPVDRSAWRIHPQQVTAYYRHGLNQVVIPAALLQAPVFDPHGDSARNFAVLGTIIGHEMSHAFDSRGSRYDDRGRVRDWWAPEDRAEFTRRTALLVEQYDRYEPTGLPGRRMSGTRTVGENIADITGVTVAQAAFAHHLSTRGETDPEHMRRFFVHWASMWRAKGTRARRLYRLATDRHAPAEFRCNGVLRHVDSFYDAFNVRLGDKLYITPESRFSLV